ncbi:ABC transporter permease [Burkholderia sp. IMCC1007]|uniref:ABC transporter permease n=1 Tax=Burkholderia sp. IMCC1007 TaxID=3004104 RepID=UPI0022B4714B|nr:ABC transporter permease [Burkholderia sp. IMCC1007]
MNKISTPMRVYLGVIAFFMLAPVLVIVAVAFTPGDFVTFPPRSLSLRWFERVLTDPSFMGALINSIRVGACATIFASMLAVPATIVLVRYRPPGARQLQMFMLSPLSLPTIILAIGLLFLNAQIGVGNAFIALIVGHTVIVVPYIMRTVFAVYSTCDPEIENAAALLGANTWRTFLHVTLPMIKPGLVAGAIFAFLMSFDEVSVALLLSDTTTSTLPVTILSYLVYNHDPAVAAISTVQIAIAVAILIVLERYFGVRRLMFSSR